MIRALEDDFKTVVGIRLVAILLPPLPHPTGKNLRCFSHLLPFSCVFCSWYLWVFVVIFLFLNVNGMPTLTWNRHFDLAAALKCFNAILMQNKWKRVVLASNNWVPATLVLLKRVVLLANGN